MQEDKDLIVSTKREISSLLLLVRARKTTDNDYRYLVEYRQIKSIKGMQRYTCLSNIFVVQIELVIGRYIHFMKLKDYF